MQKFFNDQGRAFCLYVVIGSFARRQQLVKRVNDVLGTLTIEPLDATANTTPSTTTAPPGGGAADDRGAHHRRADLDARAHHDDGRGCRRRGAVSVLAGPFAIAAVLLAVGGARQGGAAA